MFVKIVIFTICAVAAGYYTSRYVDNIEIGDVKKLAAHHAQVAEKYHALFLRDSVRLEQSFKIIEDYKQETNAHYTAALEIRNSMIDSIQPDSLIKLNRDMGYEKFVAWLDSVAGLQ